MVDVYHQAPIFSREDAQRIAWELYGARVEARPLPGERDTNFYLETELGRAFVLKIAPASEQWETLDLQNQALEHLRVQDDTLVLPRVASTPAGETIEVMTARDGSEHFVRMLTYVPGRLLAQARPHSPELLRSLGNWLGRVDGALQGFEHPAAERTLKWDLQQAAWIRDYLQYIEPAPRRALVESFFALYEQEVQPLLPGLRKSIIHNDANDYNVLVGEANESEPGRVVSVIDFGDMVHSQTVNEVAIAAAYAMLDKPDPLAAAAAVIAGYHEAFPLREDELAALYPLICTRLCVSVVNAAYQRHVEPDNEYLKISEQSAWALLERLAAVNPRFAHYLFRSACGLSADPRSDKVAQWLRTNQDKIGRVVEPDLRSADPVIFDLSIGSHELGTMADVTDLEKFNRHIFERMHEASSSVGIGRYNEVRPIYTSEQYKMPGNDGPEWRTVHIGLDLFMEPGSPVLAPLDGVVCSFRNNDLPLDYGPTIILQHTVTGQDNEPITFYTLYGHLSLDSLDGLYAGKPVAKGTAFAKIGEMSVNGGWPSHLHLQIITDLLDRAGDFPGVARPSQREVWLSLCPDPNLITAIAAERFSRPGRGEEQIRKARAAHIGPSLSIAYHKPLHIERGWMQYLYDETGRVYLDAVNNVAHVGHCHPRVVRAGQEQMAVLNTNTRYLHEYLVEYAERLCSTLPEPLSVCYFVCSGSEANELALRLARTHTGRKDVIVVDAAYHGNTGALVEISPYKFAGPGGSGAPSYVHPVPMPDIYRGAYKSDDEQAGEKYARYVEEAIRQAREQEGDVAAFICESLLGCGGQIVLPDHYLRDAYHYVHEAGGVCIADEVQTGFGRVGTHFWGFETQGVVPDIVTMGKPIGNGHPLAAVVTTPEIAASFDNGMEYFNTFGGNPVSCAIGLAVLDVIEDEQLQANALHTGTYLLHGLCQLMEKHPIIGAVRGLGLFIGVELVRDRETREPAPRQAAYIANRMRERGILLSTDGPLHNVLKIKPPLVFTAANADFLVETLDDILNEDFCKGV
ncbi:MAG TPA: aminotransferase class III-fold pyridoxal phosphate-dependent enzyme [Ktedonobacteraceae bacterium]|nr:aminotransferase class III-fold pyridoxal phosphate-dependent enzyme [Ktedonobacteraceae bacterium]